MQEITGKGRYKNRFLVVSKLYVITRHNNGTVDKRSEVKIAVYCTLEACVQVSSCIVVHLNRKPHVEN